MLPLGGPHGCARSGDQGLKPAVLLAPTLEFAYNSNRAAFL